MVVIYQKEYRIKTFLFYEECFITESIPNLASSPVVLQRILPQPCTKQGQSEWRQYSVKWSHKGGRVRGLFSATKNNSRSSSDKTITAEMKKTQEL